MAVRTGVTVGGSGVAVVVLDGVDVGSVGGVVMVAVASICVKAGV